MKYLMAAGLIMLIISHGLIQFSMFEIVQTKQRAEVLKQIKEGIPQNKLIVFKFQKSDYQKKLSKIDWKDKDEFRLDDRMYDIINKEVTRDSIYIYCILDSEETDLYSMLDKFIEDESENQNDENGLNNYFSHFYSYTENRNSLTNFFSDNKYFDYITGFHLDCNMPVTTPPPQA